jgi:hypothetical protein
MSSKHCEPPGSRSDRVAVARDRPSRLPEHTLGERRSVIGQRVRGRVPSRDLGTRPPLEGAEEGLFGRVAGFGDGRRRFGGRVLGACWFESRWLTFPAGSMRSGPPLRHNRRGDPPSPGFAPTGHRPRPPSRTRLVAPARDVDRSPRAWTPPARHPPAQAPPAPAATPPAHARPAGGRGRPRSSTIWPSARR